MKKFISILAFSLLFITGSCLVQIDDAYAKKNKKERRHSNRKAKRAYVAGAARGARRADRAGSC